LSLKLSREFYERAPLKTGDYRHNIPMPARLDAKDSEAGLVTMECHPLSGVHQFRVCEALFVNRLL
jgi:hypothetical protein